MSAVLRSGKFPQNTGWGNCRMLPKSRRIFPNWISEAGFLALSINPAHAQLAGQWNREHRDPFDRMLAAQAKIEHMPLATNDRQFETFGIEILK
jgi:PIN domain nuclease of toxin-antitoxin system